MELFLSFCRFGTLLNFLNVIFIGLIVFAVTNRYTYIVDVIAYAISKTIIPILTALFVKGIINIHVYNVTFGSVLISLILNFFIGLIVIKIIEKIVDSFDSDTMVGFIIVFGIVDMIISWLVAIALDALIY